MSTPTLVCMGREPSPGKDRDLNDLEDLERELAALEHELEIVDGTPDDTPAEDQGER